MARITLDLRSPALQSSEVFALAAKLAIEAAVVVNVAHLRQFPTPPIYASGVRYRLEPPNVEDFTDLEVLLQRGWGDCAQLVAWRVAELMVKHHERASVRLTWKRGPDGRRYFHVQVRRANGRIEDPSVLLGMNSGEAVTAQQKPVTYRRKVAV